MTSHNKPHQAGRRLFKPALIFFKPVLIMSAYGLILSGPPLRRAHVAQESRVCPGRHPDAGAWHWRQHRHLHHHQLSTVEGASLSGPTAARIAGCAKQRWAVALLQLESL